MVRARSGKTVIRKRKRLHKLTKGFRLGRGNLVKQAKITLERAGVFALRDRRAKKRSFRRLWIARLNAACRARGIRYGEFMSGLQRAMVALDRKSLSEIAIHDPDTFTKIVELAKANLPKPAKVEVGMSSTAELSSLEQRALSELVASGDESALRAWNTKYFGKQGEIALALRKVGEVPTADRKAYGQEANRIKEALTARYEAGLTSAREAALAHDLAADPLDVTLPGRAPVPGRLHISTQILRRIYAIFADMGFQVFRTREVETDENNFELLNMPPHHPARDMWDTFHTTTPGVLLRTHTSPGQIHVMKQYCPTPVRAILPGMCYRFEQVTTRSEMQFLQVEGLAIGPTITMTDLKGTITAFARRLFGQERQIRIRSSYFPFTEPSIEVDVDWPKDDPNADRLTKGTGWLEIMGAGMVHPTVLRNGGYDPAHVSGFAFGMGPQRIAMLLHGIDDIRLFAGNDLRFLRQF